jgi:hypothetical protein
MVWQLRPLVDSLGLNNPSRICLTPRKSRFKNLWRNKQGNCRCKSAVTGILSIAKLRSQMPRFATTRIIPWQTPLKCTADCQAPRLGRREYMWPGQAWGNLLSNLDSWRWQSAVRVILFVAIPGLNTADCHNPPYTFERGAWQVSEIQLPPFLHWESPCLMCHFFLTRDLGYKE